jgi:hypothetical protein
MKIISYDSSRVTLLFPLEEIVPLAGINNQLLIEEIRSRYEFARSPDLGLPRAELDKTGIKFENGIHKAKDEYAQIVDFSAYPDGIVINSKTTDGAESFLEDLICFLKTKHRFREFITEPKIRFISQIVVEFDSKLSKLMPKYQAISDLINTHISRIYGDITSSKIARLEIEFEGSNKGIGSPIPRFSLEQRVGTSFDVERYYCSAPIRTQDHVEVLEQIEKTFA